MLAKCSECGREESEHSRHVRFTLPDPLVKAGVSPDASGLWMSHGTPAESVFFQADSIGAFLRALVPVQLTGGYAVTFGVWVGVSPDDMRRAMDCWWAPS